jgi:phosphatidylserine/phosphatidylglycerophosphate/cardiolipin synthase-like enzyme
MRARTHQPILRPGSNCWVRTAAENCGLLIDGRDYYRAFYHAARQAQAYILVAGWQFDSGVRLLRGADLKAAMGEVRLLPFLEELCQGHPKLRVYILAWDYHVVFALEREWLQEWRFDRLTNERLRFMYDSQHPVGASHHQKFVVIDGELAFVGGMDLCGHRWDDRRHLAEYPERRDPPQKPYGPYHEMQACVAGPAARHLVSLFQERWARAGGGELELGEPGGAGLSRAEPTLPVAAEQVAISRTQPRYDAVPPVHEIQQLFLDAIGAAELVIYIETQYFDSEALGDALVTRIAAAKRRRPEIIIILPKQLEGVFEPFIVGPPQNRLLKFLSKLARDTSYPLGIYYSAAVDSEGREWPVYIHSKVLVVDDRFLSVGSANFNERSMTLDTELNVSWEVDAVGRRALARSVRAVRVSLLAEMCGIEDAARLRRLARPRGLVRYLESSAGAASPRLRRHDLEIAGGLRG